MGFRLATAVIVKAHDDEDVVNDIRGRVTKRRPKRVSDADCVTVELTGFLDVIHVDEENDDITFEVIEKGDDPPQDEDNPSPGLTDFLDDPQDTELPPSNDAH